MKRRHRWAVMAVPAGAVAVVVMACLLAPTLATADVRLSNDVSGGYVSAYTLATGVAYTDPVIGECSIARGRQNEPAVEIDPRNTNVLIGSSNDYGGVYAGSMLGNFVAAGPIWLGYYRSEDGGATFQSSLVPGYPGDTSPYAALAKIRTASAGDPVIAWDGDGRVFMGAVRCDPARINSRFLFFSLTAARFNSFLRQQIAGASINNLSSKLLAQFEIPLPPLATQEPIAAEAEAERQLVEANRELIARLETKIQSLIARTWGVAGGS